MKNDFFCPKCNVALNVGEQVVFVVTNPKNEGGIITLDPSLGSYKVSSHPSFELKEGELFEFYCPVCHVHLSSDINPNLVNVLMADENEKISHVLFSKIKGEQSTYKITDAKDVEAFGEHSQKYVDYVNLSLMR